MHALDEEAADRTGIEGGDVRGGDRGGAEGEERGEDGVHHRGEAPLLGAVDEDVELDPGAEKKLEIEQRDAVTELVARGVEGDQERVIDDARDEETGEAGGRDGAGEEACFVDRARDEVVERGVDLDEK